MNSYNNQHNFPRAQRRHGPWRICVTSFNTCHSRMGRALGRQSSIQEYSMAYKQRAQVSLRPNSQGFSMHRAFRGQQAQLQANKPICQPINRKWAWHTAAAWAWA